MRWLMGGQVYDVSTGSFRTADIGIAHGRIATVGSGARREHADDTIDATGLWLLPGLIDCHVHFCLGAEPDVVEAIANETPALTLLKSSRAAHQTLEAGVTTVRDVGSRDHAIFTLKQAIDTGLVPGPRIVGAGLAICMIGGHARFIGQEVEGVEQVRADRKSVV